MFRALFVVLAMLAVGLVGTAQAQNAGDPGSSVVADGIFVPSFTATTRHFAAVYRCTNPASGGGGTMNVRVRDLFLPGDIWRATITNKRSLAGVATDLMAHTANTNAVGVGGAFAPGVYSTLVTIGHDIGNQVIITAGNDIPAGLPAGFDAEITTPGVAPLVCVLRAISGGTSP